jgi:hypothetical protein
LASWPDAEAFCMSDDIVREFLVESSENLDLLDRELVQLEESDQKRNSFQYFSHHPHN